jgi:hypothetical protein
MSTRPSAFRFSVATAGAAALFALAALLPGAAGAQPFGAVFLPFGPSSGSIEVPHSPALNPTTAITLEAWVAVSDRYTCSSILGKNYQTGWWVGICGTTLRSYLAGESSRLDGGELSPGEWHHVAVVFDGTHHIHYVDGERVAIANLAGPLTTNTDPMRIGSDIAWPHPPDGGIDEVRLWNVARTEEQIRAGMHGLPASPAGLVALWPLNYNANEVAGGRNGAPLGSVNYGTQGIGGGCGSLASSTALCLQGRFLVTAKFRVGAPGTAESTAQVVPAANPGSGLFWFFASDNWEVMVKAIDACSLNDRFWIFSAATTNVFYRLDIFDEMTASQRVYINYPGPPAPAVTDTDALAVCP